MFMKHNSNDYYARLSTKSLIGMALQNWDTKNGDQYEVYWLTVSELQKRGAIPETSIIMQKLFASKSKRKRILAIDVICRLGDQVGNKYMRYAEDEARELLLIAIQDTRLDIVEAAISGLGQLTELRALPFILPYAHHNNFKLRLSVSMILGDYPGHESVQALMLLALDDEYIVRDWATFSLSNMRATDDQYMDTPEIRACLWKNVQDADLYVQGEAIRGLIYRHDKEIIPTLEQLLSQVSLYEEHATLLFDAASESGDPILWPALSRLWEQVDAEKKETFDWWTDLLLDAMNACSPASS